MPEAPDRKAAPIARRKALQNPDTGVFTQAEELTDFTPEDIKNILTKYKQQPGERPQSWLEHLMETGAETILVDGADAKLFLGLTDDQDVCAECPPQSR